MTERETRHTTCCTIKWAGDEPICAPLGGVTWHCKPEAEAGASPQCVSWEHHQDLLLGMSPGGSTRRHCWWIRTSIYDRCVRDNRSSWYSNVSLSMESSPQMHLQVCCTRICTSEMHNAMPSTYMQSIISTWKSAKLFEQSRPVPLTSSKELINRTFRPRRPSSAAKTE